MSIPDEGLHVAPCAYDAAKFAVLRWHYSGTMPAGKYATYGVWFDSAYYGAIVYGNGSSNLLHMPYGIDAMEVCELTRIALRAHPDFPVTQPLARSLDLLSESNPNLRLVISFADKGEQDHDGTLYRAANWYYLGESYRSRFWIDGKRVHGRTVFAKHGTLAIDALRDIYGDSLEHDNGAVKYRYGYPLDKGMRRTLEREHAMPYPDDDDHAVEVSNGETSGFHPEGAGSIPADRSTDSATAVAG